MKYITLIIGLLVMGCGKQEQNDANESTPTTNTNEVSGPRVQPDGDVDLLVKELTLEEKVVGEYEMKEGEDRIDLLENGVFEGYRNGKKEGKDGKWSISEDGELHIVDKDGDIGVFRINPDGSITYITVILKDGKRLDLPKENQTTFKKIK